MLGRQPRAAGLAKHEAILILKDTEAFSDGRRLAESAGMPTARRWTVAVAVSRQPEERRRATCSEVFKAVSDRPRSPFETVTVPLASGLASEKELLEHIEKLKNQS